MHQMKDTQTTNQAATSSNTVRGQAWVNRKKSEAIARHFFKKSATRTLETIDQLKLWALVQIQLASSIRSEGALNMASEASDSVQAALAARERGNAFYKSGDLIQAESAYNQAVRLALTDPRPLSNASAVKFEMGNYMGAAIFCEKVLKLLQSDPDSDLEQKARVRMGKAYTLARRPAQAAKAVGSLLDASEEKRQIEQAAHAVEASDQLFPEPARHRAAILDRLSRFKFALQDEPEYYSVGHDDPEPEFNVEMANSKQDDYSFLFAGIGDARNLFATLITIGALTASNPSLMSKKFHFTLLDIKPAVFARDLLMFRLLLDAAQESSAKTLETLVALSYLFTASTMPAWAYSRIQTAIGNLLGELEVEDSPIMNRVYVSNADRKIISTHLQTWQKGPQGWYNTPEILARVQGDLLAKKTKRTPGQSPEADNGAPSGCQSGSPDVLEYEDLGVMLPHTPLIKEHEDRLVELLREYRKKRTPGNKRKLDHYFQEQWMPNMTLIDFVWETKRADIPGPPLDFTPHKTASLLWGNLPPGTLGKKVSGALPHLEGFFRSVAKALEEFPDHTTFEIVIDDMVNYFECAKQGLLRSDGHSKSTASSNFPDTFDRIHMSNIPDYVGGAMATFLHALPILRPKKTSTVTSNVLRNTRVWATHDSFLVDSLLLAGRAKIENTFAASLAPDCAQVERALDGKLVSGMGAIMVFSMKWTRQSTKALEWSKLMPRRSVEHWLHALFFRLCLPFPWVSDFGSRVLRPLNLTALFRLVVHLFKMGYPASWLSNILNDLATGEISSTARPPREPVTDAAAAKTLHPSKPISMRPFATEYRMLLSLWRRLLPFGLLLQEAVEKQLPDPPKIRQFQVKFVNVDQGFFDFALRDPSLPDVATMSSVLVFWNRTVNGAVPTGVELREALLDDESVKSMSFLKAKLRQIGRPESEHTVHMVSTAQWNREARMVSFWFPGDVVEGMLSGLDDWFACIWSTGSWTHTATVPVGPESVVGGSAWC
ncbi:tetratricopeptide [Apiospora phragmitis]|uniref:Tetratricopeptide n=1 Tax=Apiospora phragmitis TaxID=2905665 RepID=A0ABR1V0D5_9PEZI